MTIDFVDVPDEIRRLVIDALTLAHLLGGKRNFFRVPDPLTNRRLLMDCTMFARMRIILEQLESLLCALRDEELTLENLATAEPFPRIAIGRSSRVMTDMDHFVITAKQIFKDRTERGVPDVRKSIQRVLDLSPSASSLVRQLRERHRRYQSLAGG